NLLELSREVTIDIDTSDHQRSEKVAFAAFVDAKMRLQHFGFENLFIAELGFSQDFGFESEFDEVFRAPALDDELWSFFVNGDRELVSLRKVEGVGARFEFVSLLAQQGS